MSRIGRLIDALRTFYGTLPSPPRDPFALFVWEVLSVRSTPRQRDAAYAALKKIRALTPDAVWHAPAQKLEASVALAGPYAEQRLSALKTGADRFRREPRLAEVIRGPLAPARRALTRLPQMGSGGAHTMLLFAADHPVMPVDAAVGRVAQRLGYGNASGSRSVRARAACKALVADLGSDLMAVRQAFVYLSNHGASTCLEIEPHCAVCPLLHDCAHGRAIREGAN